MISHFFIHFHSSKYDDTQSSLEFADFFRRSGDHLDINIKIFTFLNLQRRYGFPIIFARKLFCVQINHGGVFVNFLRIIPPLFFAAPKQGIYNTSQHKNGKTYPKHCPPFRDCVLKCNLF